MSFLEKMTKVGRGFVDAGTKAMLKTDIIFLEREIKSRKQSFGVTVYELMETLELDDTGMSIEEKEGKIRLAFDRARKDIAVVQAKIECKKEEITVLEAQAQAADGTPHTTTANNIPPNSGHLVMTGHPSEKEDYEYGNMK